MQQTALDQNILFDQNCNVFTNILFCNRKYTEYTHVAGTPGDEKLVQELYDTWVDQELDHVEKSTYEVKKVIILEWRHVTLLVHHHLC